MVSAVDRGSMFSSALCVGLCSRAVEQQGQGCVYFPRQSDEIAASGVLRSEAVEPKETWACLDCASLLSCEHGCTSTFLATTCPNSLRDVTY
jgi:hypothetical protein